MSKAVSNSQSPSSGSTGFVPWCDLGGAQRIQTFVPNQTGNLSTVSVTSFLGGNPGNTFPDAGLTIQIVEIDANAQPGKILFTTTADQQLMGYAARNVIIKPNIPVVAGKEYGIRLKAAISKGCYGFVYNDSNPYPQGRELYSSNGITFIVEPSRSIKFGIIVEKSNIVPGNSIYLNLAGSNYTDSDGNSWQGIKCPADSAAFSTTADISGTSNPVLYKDECYSFGTTPYIYSVGGLNKAGSYQVVLKFAEISYEKTGQRLFNVDINGSRVLNSFDVFSAAGGSYKAVDKSFMTTADSNGTINITLSPIFGKSSATISAIQINPQ